MELLPEIEQISVLKNNQSVVLEKVKSSPVLLMQRSKPVAVMVSPEAWNAAAKRMKQLEEQLARQQQLILSNQRYTDMLVVPTTSASEEADQQMFEDDDSGSELRPFGLCAGEFVVPDDFDEPLPNNILDLFESA
ncbi:type II toxin-antitoxin system Phd/YefM family antitoxin [Chloroflexi bacterium TSY]|nr:type II toxin-antitoxin system Phd/YefM family antitoxin [Chloroflexi bacterium TSY]